MPFIDEAVKDNNAVFLDSEGRGVLQSQGNFGRRERQLTIRRWTVIKVR